jgi:hypothetical protein
LAAVLALALALVLGLGLAGLVLVQVGVEVLQLGWEEAELARLLEPGLVRVLAGLV